MSDFAHEYTDKEIEALEKRITKAYRRVYNELSEKVTSYFEQFEKRDTAQRALLNEGKITELEYQQWRLAQIGRGKRFEAMRDDAAERLTKANQIAASYIKDEMPDIFAINLNHMAYGLEKEYGNIGFTIYDENMAKKLIADEADFLPAPSINVPKDLWWNKKLITAEMTSGILQGESIGKLADRFQNVTDANRVSAIRNARTFCTAAENAGRQESLNQAAKLGVKVRKQWLATLDNRTRHSHQLLDGQIVDYDKPFKSVLGSKMMYPAEKSGAKAGDLYNCRCTIITVEKSGIVAEEELPVTTENGQNISGMNYKEWEMWKKTQRQEEIEPVRKQTERITQEEWDVLEDYVSGEGMDTNNFLRQMNGLSVSMMNDAEKQRLSLIDSAMSKSELQKEQILYRSVDASAVFDKDALKKIRWGEYSDEDLQSFVGKTITDKGFMSTTTDKEIAFGWGDFTGSESPIVLQLDTPKGTHGIDLRRFDVEGEEQKEILLDRGLSYKITSIKTEKMRLEDEFGEYYETSIVVKAKVKKK